MIIGKKSFLPGHTYVCGILNVTPDSFSDGGRYGNVEAAVEHALRMAEEGAELIDIGGESTRPGAAAVNPETEIRRVVPVIRALREVTDLPISLDTYHPETAAEGLAAGADLINDVKALAEPGMAEVIAGAGASVCLMHSRAESIYKDLIGEVREELTEAREKALGAGIPPERILLDPGIGFGKNPEQNLKLLAHLADFQDLGAPVLLGASRKSVIGYALDLPVEERLEGTLATTALAVEAGCLFVRIHDVKANVRLIRMLEAVRERG